jgi:hypothetical protein
MTAPVSFREKVRFFSLAPRAPSIHDPSRPLPRAAGMPRFVEACCYAAFLCPRIARNQRPVTRSRTAMCSPGEMRARRQPDQRRPRAWEGSGNK